jgi:hypothetical protein
MGGTTETIGDHLAGVRLARIANTNRLTVSNQESIMLAFRTIGRVQAVIEMLDEPKKFIYRMDEARALGLIRGIIEDYKLNRSVEVGP